VTRRLSVADRLTAWIAAFLAPPLAGTSLVRRVTAAASSPPAGAPAPAQAAAELAALTEDHVRRVAHFARAPRVLGLPGVPGWRDTCLSRAYASTLALRARGYPAALAIGVRTHAEDGTRLAAHAWVTLGGQPVLDEQAPAFTELAPSRPEPAAGASSP